MTRFILMLAAALLTFGQAGAQAWWKKSKKDAIPSDLKKHKFLAEQFEYVDPEDLDLERDLSGYAFDKADSKKSRSTSSTGLEADVTYDYEKKDLMKQKIEDTNAKLSKYNKEVAAAFDSAGVAYKMASSAAIAGPDSAQFDKNEYRYALRHKYVYYRSSTTYQGFYVPAGYNITWYFYDRLTGKSYPPIRIHAAGAGYPAARIAEKLGKL